MERRKFLKSAGAGLAGRSPHDAAPSRRAGRGPPEVKWRLASSFPKTLDTIYGGAEVDRQARGAATSGKFQIQVFAGGEIVPAVRRGRRACRTARSSAPHRAVLFLRQGSDVRVRLRDPVRPERAPDRTRGCTTAAAWS